MPVTSVVARGAATARKDAGRVGVSLEWADLLAALGLCLIIEGIIPFLSPNSLRRALALMLTLENWPIRLLGVLSMAAGLVVLYLARH